MLSLLYGPAHSGKTDRLRARIRDTAAAGKKAVLLVPEQASFTNEKELTRQLGTHAALVSVVSFTRLAELLLRELGGGGRTVMDDTAAYLMMGVALGELSDVLTLYRRHSHSRGFLEQMVKTAGECKNAGITPQKLAQFALGQPNGSLRDKSYELSLILDVYDGVVQQSYVSEADLISMAAEKLAGSDFFADTQLLVDDFGGFTAPELELLEAVLGQSPRVTVALCCDRIDSREPAFSLAVDTVERLSRIARKAGAAVVSEAASGEFSAPSPEWRAMERATRAETLPDAADGGEQISVFAASDPYAELEYVAASIVQLVREQGVRYREITVMARSLERYRTALAPIFERYGIPFFLDLRADARCGVLTAGLFAAVSVAGEPSADPLTLAKSPLMGLDAQEAGELENYCFVWMVRPSQWARPFVNHPDGLHDGMNAEAAARLARIERCRRQVMEPVLRLRTALRRERGSAFAHGVYDFLRETDAARHLTDFAADMTRTERQEFFDQQSQLWEGLMKLLDLFATLPDSLRLVPARALELFELTLGTVQVATPPRTLDQVLVGTVDRTRPNAPCAVFLLGAVEGEFPAVPSPGGVLSDADRRCMIAGGLELLGDSERFSAQERMFCYRAVTASRDRLAVSYPRAESTGEGLAPSVIYSRAAVLGRGSRRSGVLPEAQTPQAAVAALCARSNEKTPETAALRVFCARHFPPRTLSRIDRASRKTPHHLDNPILARELFGERMRLSPSRLERYYSCPFSYFVQSGLGIRPRRRAELSPLETGTLIHRVLERMVARYGGKGLDALDRETLDRAVHAEVQDYITERISDPETLPKRVLYGFDRIGEWLVELLARLGAEFAQSQFEPIAFELSIGVDGSVAPLTLQTPDGRTIRVEGSVDRVDVATIGGERYVRVVDYKSGGKIFRLSDVFYGLNMQMLIYLFSICQNGREALGNLLPAGVLYVPALGKYHSVSRTDSAEILRRAQDKQYRMNGLLLSDPEVLRAMEADGKGIFIPIKDGQTAGDALASAAELGRIKQLVEERITGMARALSDGSIASIPVEEKGERPCRFCDYRGICGFEQGDTVRSVPVLDRADFLMEEAKNDG